MTSEESVNVPNGYKKTEFGIIPNEWNVVKLGDYADITKLAGFEYTDYFNGYQDTGEIIVVRGTNIKNNVLDLSDVKTIPKSVSNQLQRSKLSKNDLVFAYVGTIGPVAIIDENEKYHLGPNTCRITSDECTIHHKFLYTYFASYLIQKEIDKHTSVSAQPSLSMTKIRSFRIITPPLPEQHKIASILSKVDEHISQTETIIEKTEELKRGLMQQLLTKGIGHTKFKKTEVGEIPEEWDVVKLADISLELLGGGTPSTAKSEYWDGDVPWMTSAHISGRYVCSGQKYITQKGLEESATKLVPKDNILFVTRVGVGKIAINLINIAISQDITGIIVNKDKANAEFIYWKLLDVAKKMIVSLSQGSTIKGILKSDLANQTIALPPVSEQNKIANILMKIETGIELNQTYLSHLQELKKGLMQDLLTGKVRVKIGAHS